MDKQNYTSIGGVDYHHSSNKYFLIICPKCKRENYAINVASGICTWCLYNANTDSDLHDNVKLSKMVNSKNNEQ